VLHVKRQSERGIQERPGGVGRRGGREGIFLFSIREILGGILGNINGAEARQLFSFMESRRHNTDHAPNISSLEYVRGYVY
jgi:hypothetical protein